MALSEEQIRRYARQILLPEVGGVGQEKLLAAEAHVSGEPGLVELAGQYLAAAGVHVDAHSGSGLAIAIRGIGGVVVRREDGALRVISGECESCLGEPAGPISLESGAIAACLAAGEALRMIVVIDRGRAWEIRGASVARISIAPCPAHGAAS